MRHLIAAVVLASALLVATTTAAFAEVRAGAFTLAPMVGYHVFDGGLDLEDSKAFGLALGYNFTNRWALEFDARFVPTEVDARHGPDVDTLIGTVNTLYHFTPERDLVPYLALGIGALQYDIDNAGSNDEDFLANWGGGFKYAVADNIDLRLDVRHILDYRSDNRGHKGDGSDWRHQMSAMFGLNFQFGGTSAVPTKVELPVAPLVQETVPAPAAAPAPQDSDGDGVLDAADKCPGTPAGARVDAEGCPADSDGDGVPDYLDACLDTPKGARVDEKGCPFVIKPIETLTLYLLFATDKDQVTPFHYRELDRAYAFIQKFPDLDVFIEGHADNRGTDDYNQKLSQRRAENVRKVLIEKYGVSADRISAKWFGENQPVATNDTASGREQNRRVIISIMQ